MNFVKGFIKLSPVMLLATLMILKVNALTAAPIATIYAALVAMVLDRLKSKDVFDAAITNVKEMQIVFFILMLAYAMASAFMTTGVGASIINISLNLGLSARTIAVTGIIVTGILSVATGTSWGTFAACAPIFLWLNHIVDGNILLTTAAIAGGACFGDNIGLISDTTIVSSGIQKVEVMHRIRHQGVWSLMCLVLSAITFYLVSLYMGLPTTVGNAADAINSIPKEAFETLAVEKPAAIELLNQVKSGVPYYMVIPLILVIICAFRGVQTLLCLLVGIISSFILGLFAGTVDSLSSFLTLVQTGFADAGSWVIVMMMWVGAFGGIMAKMNAFAPISKFFSGLARNVRQLSFLNGILCLLGNIALSDEMAQIVTVGPIIKELTDENVEGSEEDLYKLRLRNATMSDALGVFGALLIPWHVYVAFFTGIASAVYPLHKFVPLDLVKFNFMSMIAVVSILFLTLTGLDRFVPLFRLPSEPDVRLKRSTKKI
ncbi:Na+/H+ antiporter NhaC family protein [Clostridium hydrogeniformans]|uniref:Na+/H+ antiporter NhaC family protein n=1 Tax=Clostridium hydrogeniformans TaxID=349933 RepID=UPI000488E0EE|nr:Na+/H+ antiporter NhaC family protein [Clostridium hydrogeniformans]